MNNTFKKGDIVAVKNADTIGIVSVAEGEKATVCLCFKGKELQDSRNTETFSFSDLEPITLPDGDIRKGYLDYLSETMALTSLWGGKGRNPQRIPFVLETIGEVWKKCPDYRLGQLLTICGGMDLFSVEDKKLMEGITDFISRIKK